MELAFAGLHQLCAPFLDQIDRLPTPQHGALGTAFGLRSGDPPDRFLVGLAVLTLLSEAAETQPVVCLVDDAQWLDRATVQVLGFVARRLAAEAVVIVFAARESADIPDFAALTELRVPPLADPDARAVLASATPTRLDESVRDRIVAEARGNPLALLELPKAWTTAAMAGGFGLPDGVSVPTRVEESFRRRLTPLPDPTRQLLLVAAAEPVGDPILVWAAAERLGIPADAASPAISSGLLSIGAQLRFRHPLVRSVVYREASTDDRRLAHAALAAATDATVDPDRRAWHLAAATTGPNEDVASELEGSAGRAQARGGVGAAAAFLQRAVALTVDPTRRRQRALAAAQTSLQAGEFETALELANVAEAGPLEEFQRVQLGLLRAHVAFASGLGGDAPPLLLEAAKRLEPFDAELARQTFLIAWGAAVFAGQAEVVLEICRAVRALPSSDPPRPLDLTLRGLALLTTDGRSAATPTLQQASAGLVDMSVQDVLGWGWVANGVPTAIWDDARYLTLATRQVQLVRDAGALAVLPIYLAALGIATAWIGDFAGAAALVEEADGVAAATGSPIGPYPALRLVALRGSEAEAVPVIEAALQQATVGGQRMAATQANWAAAVLYNGLARYEEAASAAHATWNSFEPWIQMFALPELVEAAVRKGDPELAGAALVRLADTTQPCGTDLAIGIEARSRALVSEDETAQALFREAIERLGRTLLRPELARAHLLYGEWLRRQGRRVDAREQLRTAYDLFAEIGMEAFAERARRELVATGERVRKRTVETFRQVTPQELQIARLAGGGQTNQEIATQLFLSTRTVEWHLGKVFAKLGVESRRDLPAALAPVPRSA